VHRRAGAGDDRDPVPILKARRHRRIAIAPHRHLRTGPALRHDSAEPPLIFRRCAAREECPDMRRLRQHAEKPQQRLVGDQLQI
jgi:hypothetical protein